MSVKGSYVGFRCDRHAFVEICGLNHNVSSEKVEAINYEVLHDHDI